MDEKKPLKLFAALARKTKTDFYTTIVVEVESKEAAEDWFGKNSYHVLGSVYPRAYPKK